MVRTDKEIEETCDIFIEICNRFLDKTIEETFDIKNERLKMEVSYFPAALFTYDLSEIDTRTGFVINDDEQAALLAKSKTYLLKERDGSLTIKGAALKASNKPKIFSRIIGELGSLYLERDLTYDEDIKPYYMLENASIEDIVQYTAVKPPEEYSTKGLQYQLGIQYEEQLDEKISGKTGLRYVVCKPDNVKKIKQHKKNYYIITNETSINEVPRVHLEHYKEVIDTALEALTLHNLTKDKANVGKQMDLFSF